MSNTPQLPNSSFVCWRERVYQIKSRKWVIFWVYTVLHFREVGGLIGTVCFGKCKTIELPGLPAETTAVTGQSPADRHSQALSKWPFYVFFYNLTFIFKSRLKTEGLKLRMFLTRLAFSWNCHFCLLSWMTQIQSWLVLRYIYYYIYFSFLNKLDVYV